MLDFAGHSQMKKTLLAFNISTCQLFHNQPNIVRVPRCVRSMASMSLFCWGSAIRCGKSSISPQRIVAEAICWVGCLLKKILLERLTNTKPKTPDLLAFPTASSLEHYEEPHAQASTESSCVAIS